MKNDQIRISVSEARRRFSDLLREVERGSTIVITRNNVDVAEWRACQEPRAAIAQQAAETIRRLRRGMTAGNLPIRRMRAMGRKR